MFGSRFVHFGTLLHDIVLRQLAGHAPIVENTWLRRRSKRAWPMTFHRIYKCTDSLLDDTFAPTLWVGRAWLALGDRFVRASQQPHGPQGTADTDQQHPQPLWLDDPTAFPVKQRALQAFPTALVPPATGIRHQSLLRGGQTRHHIPADRPKALACPFVATHSGPAAAAFPDADLLQKAPVVWLERQGLERDQPRLVSIKLSEGARKM